MEYDSKVGGVAPVVVAAVYVGSAVVSSLVTMYGNGGEKQGTPVDTEEIADEYAKKMVEKSKQDNPENPITYEDARKHVNEHPELINEVAGSVKQQNIVVTDKRGILQKFAEDIEGSQKAGHGAFVSAVSFGVTWPWQVAKNALGIKPEEEQRAFDRKKWEDLGYKPDQVNQALRLKAQYPNATDAQIIQSMQRRRIGRGEISGLQIAKLVLLVLVIIIVFASAYTGSKMMLGFLPFLLLGLGGMFLYDYLKIETPKDK